MKEVKLQWGLGALLIKRKTSGFLGGKRIFAPSGKKAFECEKCRLVVLGY